jgi:Bacterial Ig-like domain (group 2)
MLTGRKLPLSLAFAVLIVVATGVSCKGFFTDPVLSSIAIQPPTPSVEVGQTTTLQAWGTYSPDNSRSQITSGVAWTSATPGAVCFVSGTTCVSSVTGGTVTIQGVAPGGTSSITAAAQGIVSPSATATAFLGTVTGFEVCLGTFSSTSCPTPTADVSSQSGGAKTFSAQATFNNEQLDLTTESTWTVSPSAGGITCVSTTSPATCTVLANTTAQTYTVTAAYGTSNSATGKIVVGP